MNAQDTYRHLIEGIQLQNRAAKSSPDLRMAGTGDPPEQPRDTIGRNDGPGITMSRTRIGSPAIAETLKYLLRHDDPFVRTQFVEVVQRTADEGFDSFAELMNSPEAKSRIFAVDLFSCMPGAAAEEVYRLALQDDDPEVVIAAVENIGMRRRVNFRDSVVLLAVNATDSSVASASLTALAEIGDASSLAILRTHYQDQSGPDSQQLVPFLLFLGSIGDEKAINDVCQIIQERGLWLLDVAIESIQRIQSRHRLGQGQISPSSWTLLRHALTSAKPSATQYRLIRVLSALGNHDLIAFELVRFLWDPDKMVRMATVEAMGRSTCPGIRQALTDRSLTEEDPEVRAAIHAQLSAD